MPLTCLSLTNGLLLTTDPPLQRGTTVNTPNGTTITSTTSGGAPGITVTKGASNEFFPEPLGGRAWFYNWGNPANFVAIVTTDSTAAGPQSRSVVVVDTTGATLATQLVFTTLQDSTNPLPHLNPSQGNGAVAMMWAGTGSGALGTVNPRIVRSDNGDTLCAAVPFNPSGQVNGEVTATQLLIKEGGTAVMTCPRPAGECQVTPDPRNFPEAVIGGLPASATSVRQATITNTGDDCLTISAIGNVAPYSVAATSMPLPATLPVGGTMTVDILFAPTAPGTHNQDLPVTRSPAAGDAVIRCRGTARNAVRAISFSGSLPFGTIPVGSTTTRSLTINNTGDLPVTVGAAAAPVASDFRWNAWSPPAIGPGASASLSIDFVPSAEGAQSMTLGFTSDAPVAGTSHAVTLTGTGCIARAGITVPMPAGPGLDFGRVERGFRTVRMVRVANPGNGPLSFRASVSGSALFGVQRDGASFTILNATDNFTVNPVTACGPLATGPGEVVFGVLFFADAAPGPVTGTLVIDNHNAAGGAPASFSFTLQAEVVNAISVDAHLVLDRSGSMNDMSGSRTKSATVIDAARLFVELGRADVDDRVGLVRFNTAADTFASIAPVTAASKPALVAAINPNSLAPTGGTSITAGVMTGLADAAANPRTAPPADLKRVVVALTDGHENSPYVSGGVTYTLLGEGGTTALTVPAGTGLYALGIGDSIDAGRLGQLAMATGGEFLHVREFSGTDFFQLEKHFTQIYMDTRNLATIQDPVFTIVAGATHVIPFDVLRGDVACMVVIYDRDGIRIPFYLETPAGEIIDLVSVPAGFQIRPGVTATARFVEVGFPMGDPTRYAGSWKLVVHHDGRACFANPRGEAVYSHNLPRAQTYDVADFGSGFQPATCKPWGDPIMYGFAVGVGSNFRMMPWVEPGVVEVGDPIRLLADVSECGLPVTGCNVTVESRDPGGTVRSHVMLDDGGHGDGDPSDGSYGHSFVHTMMEGTYQFTFRATGWSRDGEPVYREAVRSKYVQGRVPLIPVDTTGGGDGTPGGKDECCETNQRWLRIIAVLLVLTVIALLLIWRAI